MIEVSLNQYSRPLVETMYISRGGFKSRSHNIISITFKGKSFFSEVIGDSEHINFLFKRLFESLKKYKAFAGLEELFGAVDDWINSFVYLELHSSVSSIGCAFDWLKVITKSYFEGKSIFDLLSLPKPTRKFSRVYGSNLYWKSSIDDFKNQIKSFDFSKTSILKFHLGRMSPQDEYKYYECIEENNNIEKYMIDLNCGYTIDQLNQLSKYLLSSEILAKKILWLEEPTHPDLAKYWYKYTSINLAAGENHHGVEQLTSLSENCINWIMPDFGRTLRLSEFQQLLKKISKNSAISFHSYSSGFLAYLSLLISTALPSEKTLYEHDFSDNALLKDIIQDSLYVEDGYAYIDPLALHELNLNRIDDTWTNKSISLEI